MKSVNARDYERAAEFLEKRFDEVVDESANSSEIERKKALVLAEDILNCICIYKGIAKQLKDSRIIRLISWDENRMPGSLRIWLKKLDAFNKTIYSGARRKLAQRGLEEEKISKILEDDLAAQAQIALADGQDETLRKELDKILHTGEGYSDRRVKYEDRSIYIQAAKVLEEFSHKARELSARIRNDCEREVLAEIIDDTEKTIRMYREFAEDPERHYGMDKREKTRIAKILIENGLAGERAAARTVRDNFVSAVIAAYSGILRDFGGDGFENFLSGDDSEDKGYCEGRR